MNRKKGLFNKRIPTAFALVVLVIIVGVSIYMVQREFFYQSHAAPDTLPQNLTVTNITDSSFTVVFTTNGSEPAIIDITNGSVGNSIIFDDRDKKDGNKGNYFSHHITAPNLSPSTTYSFEIIVGGKNYNDPSYKATTGPAISTPPPTQNPLVGTVLEPDSTPAKDTLVTAVTSSSQTLSAVTNSRGQFIIPTNSLRDVTNTNYITLSDDSPFTITAFQKDSKSSVKSDFAISQNLPPIALQQQYTFAQQSQTTQQSSSQLQVQLPASTGKTIDILKPTEGENFVDTRPLFSGVSYPNSPVTIKIPNIVDTQITSSGVGAWSFRPDKELAPGNQTITIESPDNTGTVTQIKRNFSVFPLGSTVEQSATNSATPTLTPSPTPTTFPTPTPTSVPTTPSPTIASTPTPTTSLLPSPTASVTATIFPTSTPTRIPTITNPGGTQDTIILTGVSVILIIAGAALLFAL